MTTSAQMYARELEIYQQVQGILPDLYGKILQTLDSQALRTCCKRLGMIRQEESRWQIHCANEQEAEILQDYCMFMYQPRGISAVGRMANRRAFTIGSEKQDLLKSLAAARFSLFWVEDTQPDCGLRLLDVMSGEHFLLLSPVMARAEAVGMLSGFRLFSYEGCWLHTGINIPVGQLMDPGALQPEYRALSVDEECDLNEQIIARWKAGMGSADAAKE